jgi:FMN reductase
MSSSFSLVSVNGSPKAESKTGTLIELATEAIATRVAVDVTAVRPYALGPGLTGATAREEVSEDVEQVLRAVEGADMLIAGSPVFQGSYTGMFKHFFDLIDPYALEDVPVLLIATGGSERHSLVLEHQMQPLFAHFQAHTLPVAIYGSAGDFIGATLYNPPVLGRIERAADMAAILLNGQRQRRAVAKVIEPVVA